MRRLLADHELARIHCDGHCHEAVMWCVHHLPEQMKTLTLSDEKVYDFSVSIERVRCQMVGRPRAPQLDLFT